MEDTGTLQAVTFLSHAGLVQRDRVLVLRTGSNYDQQRPGISAAESLAETKIGQYSAYVPALESAWRVGRVVVEEIVRGWGRYRDDSPGR
jgi:purine nucleoside permease